MSHHQKHIGHSAYVALLALLSKVRQQGQMVLAAWVDKMIQIIQEDNCRVHSGIEMEHLGNGLKPLAIVEIRAGDQL